MKQKQSLSVTKFKNALISGYHSIYNQRYYLNSINVFPVPDGDTGSNLNYTVRLGIEKIINQQFSSLKTLFLSFNQGLLLGARGNSGVIFSEIFRGFCMGIPKDNKLLNNNILLDCFVSAKIIAYQAVIKPVEGTMLTIIRCIATMLRRFREKINSWSLVKTFTKIIVNCEETLFQTSGTSANNNVVKNVDAGAFALKVFFEGMLIYFRSNVIVRKLSSEELKKYHFIGKKQTATAFGFCTALTVKMFDQGQRKLLTKKLTTTTINSLVVAGDDVMCKVHGHTTRPGTMLDILQDHGELLQIKIDNMSLQHQTATNHTDLSECEAHVVVKKVLTPQEILLITENSQLSDYFTKEFQVKHQLVLDQKQPLTWLRLRKKISTIQTKQLLIISSQNESNGMTIPSARANTVLPNLK